MDEEKTQDIVLPEKIKGYGPLDGILNMSGISEILIQAYNAVYVEQEGQIKKVNFSFSSEADYRNWVSLIEEKSRSMLTAEEPFLNFSESDLRFHIVNVPITKHPVVTIRKNIQNADLSELGFDLKCIEFIKKMVKGKLNILIAGSTSSGKTTLLSSLLKEIEKKERLIVIEDTPEIKISHPLGVRLLTKTKTVTSPAISAKDLLIQSLRMRPDRIVVGECRGEETLSMLQALNTGHLGSMTTIHANSSRDALTRLEHLCLLYGENLSSGAVRFQISSAFDVCVFVTRLPSGKRVIASIDEILNVESQVIIMQNLFYWKDHLLQVSGYVPTFLEKLAERSIYFSKDFFHSTNL